MGLQVYLAQMTNQMSLATAGKQSTVPEAEWKAIYATRENR
jgi:hypothetical protein